MAAYITFFAIFFIILFILRNRRKRTTNVRLPYGDTCLPWIGETVEFYKAQRMNQLYEEFFHPRLKKHGNVFKTNLMGSPTVVVNGTAANKFFMSNEFKLVVSSWPTSSVELMGKNSIMEKQGDSHRCLRGIITSTVNISGLEAMVPRMCNSIQKHMEKNWQNREEISLCRSTKMLTFTIVLECLFGIGIEPDKMFGVFERVLEGVLSPLINFPGIKFSRTKKARSEIEKVLISEVRKKRGAMENGRDEDSMLFSKLVAALIRGEITEDEVVDNIVLMVFAPHDTTSYAITMTSGEALTFDDVKEMEYTWQVARETMRLCPPIFGSFRKATTDIQFEGITIPKDWKVLWTTYGTHYDEKLFPDPMSFNPSRFEDPVQAYSIIPFGGGPSFANAEDKLWWKDLDGKLRSIAVSHVWQAIRPRSNSIDWLDVVWFSQSIPRNAFLIWLLMGERLKTQDKLRAWDVDSVTNIEGMLYTYAIIIVKCDMAYKVDMELVIFTRVEVKTKPANMYTRGDPQGMQHMQVL
ncbi:taxadiene 5-alpha hydroxylase [Tanacetum coccineum]